MKIEAKRVQASVTRALASRLGALAMLVPAASFTACGAPDPAGPSRPSEGQSAEALLAATDCDSIEAQLRVAQQKVEQILALLEVTPPGREHDDLLRQLRLWTARVNTLQAELNRCRHPLPDLVAASVVISPRLDGTAIDAALLVRNDGRAAANGSFNITFAATIPGSSRQATFRANSVSIPAGSIYVSEYMRNIATIRDEQGVATYRFDAIVDSDQELAESNEGNNSLTSIVQDPVPTPSGPPHCPVGYDCCVPIDDNGGCSDCRAPGSVCR